MKQPKCGCVYDEKAGSFTKYCREHALMILRKRFEKLSNREPRIR
jgi:hypothetical protein